MPGVNQMNDWVETHWERRLVVPGVHGSPATLKSNTEARTGGDETVAARLPVTECARGYWAWQNEIIIQKQLQIIFG
jgi:hypothetical protein